MIAYAFVARGSADPRRSLLLAGLDASFQQVLPVALDHRRLDRRVLVAQFLDVTVFWALRGITGRRQLCAHGSTVVSQIVDTLLVGFIGLHLPYRLYGPGWGVDFETYLRSAASGYLFKFVVAVGATPLLYLGHAAADDWIGHQESDALIEAAARPEEGGAPS
jgi:hypothetical protein